MSLDTQSLLNLGEYCHLVVGSCSKLIFNDTREVRVQHQEEPQVTSKKDITIKHQREEFVCMYL